jgi:outer membrane cobalamin receptor
MINTTYDEYILNHNILKENLLETQEKEKNILIDQFQKNLYKQNLNNSPKLKELERLKIYYLNKKDFAKANYYDYEIENLIKLEKEKNRIKNQNNLKLKLKNLEKIHEKQINEFEHQFKKKCDKYNIDKKNELLKIIHRQKKELENLKKLYKEEKNNLKNNKKNISLFQNISISNNSNLTDI